MANGYTLSDLGRDLTFPLMSIEPADENHCDSFNDTFSRAPKAKLKDSQVQNNTKVCDAAFFFSCARIIVFVMLFSYFCYFCFDCYSSNW